MECESSLLETALPAITALVGVLLTLIVQGVIEKGRRRHETKFGGRLPLTVACEDLISLLEEQMSALTDIEGLVGASADVSTHPSLEVLARKSYRTKLWAVIDDQTCVQPINLYARTVESFVSKLLASNMSEEIANEIITARNALGNAMRNITKHIAEIWELEIQRD